MLMSGLNVINIAPGEVLSSNIQVQLVVMCFIGCELTFMATCMGLLSPLIPRTCPSQTSPNAPWPRALKNKVCYQYGHQHRQTDILTLCPGGLYLRSVMFFRGTSFSSLSEAAFPAKQQLGLQSVMMVEERILLSLYSGLCRRPLTACRSFFLRYHTKDKDKTETSLFYFKV